MIYTLTLNPSLDYIVTLKKIQIGSINRTEEDIITPGGKGINVSIVLKNLGIDSTALGFIAGFTGAEIEKRLELLQCNSEFIHLERGNSRINVKIIENESTEINAKGPNITKKDLVKLGIQLGRLQSGDVLVLAGAIPPSLPNYIYGEIISQLSQRGILIIVDAIGEVLSTIFQYKPFLVKPNLEELGEIFSVRLQLDDDVIRYASKVKDMGAQNVLVSMGSRGAILITEDGTVMHCTAPQGIERNSVGAGDSMIAGFLYGLEKTNNLEDALKYSIAAGSASAFSDNLAIKSDVDSLRMRL